MVMSETATRQPCELRVRRHLEQRLNNVARLCHAARRGTAFHYVAESDAAGRGYYRYALSDGAQHDELRFFVIPGLACERIEYWFFDGPDSAWRNLTEYYFDAFLPLWDAWRAHRV
jgi:hypothetical protein